MLLLMCASALAIDIYEGEDLFTAIAALEPGDELVVHEGTYTTQASSGSYYRAIELLGTEEAPIVVRAAEGEVVVIEGDPAGSQNTVDLSGSWYTWQGFEMVYGSHGLRLGGSDHGQILDLLIHDTWDVGLSMNRSGETYTEMLVRGVEIHTTGGTGECMYLGCNEGACAVNDSLIEGNFCHDTAHTEQGDGIELKSGSEGNVIQYNVTVGTNCPGITGYGTYGGAPNLIRGNLVWDTLDNGIQIVGEVAVEDNLVIDAGAYGIYSKSSQGAVPESLSIVHNTVLNAAEGCLRVNDWDSVADAVVANNALLCPDSRAVRLGSGTGASIWAGNVTLGDTDGASGVTDGGSLAALVVDADLPDLVPAEGSALLDAGEPSAATALDFDCAPRSNPPDVGAYQRFTGAPDWPIQADFRPLCAEAGSGDPGDTGPDEDTGDSGAPDADDSDPAGDDSDPAGDDSDPAGDDSGEAPKDMGCGCAGAPSAAGAPILALALIGLARRRSLPLPSRGYWI